MKIIIAPDSFKGSVTSVEAAQAIRAGIDRVISDAQVISIPMADGGEGTVDALVAATDGEILTDTVHSPFGDLIEAKYGVLGDHKTDVIEVAEASGIQYKTENTQVAEASSLGTGELILHAVENGFRKIILGLGGSATNDGGAGILRAFGVKFLDQEGQELAEGGLALNDLAKIDLSQMNEDVQQTHFILASDVTSPLTGPTGATYLFGPQKGVTEELLPQLESALANYAKIMQEQLDKNVAELPGAGAAGGIGAGMLAFTNAKLQPGIDLVLDATGFDQAVLEANLVLTGEGAIDSQSKFGKVPYGVAKRAKEMNPNVVVVALAGKVSVDVGDLYPPIGPIDVISAIATGAKSLEQAQKETVADLTISAENLMRLYVSAKK